MRHSLPDADVLGISVELTTFCNLNCRLCAHQYASAKKLLQKETKPVLFWKKCLSKYTSLQMVAIAGILSEPTLYQELFELLKWLKDRHIRIELYTNGNTHDEVWWRKLGTFLTKDDAVVFTICGSTQQLHAKYRVGSNLSQLLKNAAAFRNTNKNDCCQHILFEYNKEDLWSGKMDPIFNTFSKKMLINSLPYQERFNIIPGKTDICMQHKLSAMYKFIQKKAFDEMPILRANKTYNVKCKNYGLKFLWLDSNGKPWPCFVYQLNMDKFDNNDYTDIMTYKHDFCFECERSTLDMLDAYGIEAMG